MRCSAALSLPSKPSFSSPDMLLLPQTAGLLDMLTWPQSAIRANFSVALFVSSIGKACLKTRKQQALQWDSPLEHHSAVAADQKQVSRDSFEGREGERLA